MITNEDAPMMDTASIVSQKSRITLSSESSNEMLPLVKHHEASAAVGSKRHQNFPVENSEVSSSKYPKLTTVEQTFELQEGQSASSSSDGFSGESSDIENRNQGENGHPESSGHSTNEDVQLHSKNPEAAEVDSNDSGATSPQKKNLNNHLISMLQEKESRETITKLMSIATALRIQNHKPHTSQFTFNNDLENNNIKSVLNLETTIKQSNSQVFSSCNENTDEPVNVISIPENSTFIESQDEYIHPENLLLLEGSDQTKAHSNSADVTEKVTNLQKVAPNCLYAVTTQSLRQPTLKMEYNNSQDQNSQLSQDTYPEQVYDEQPIRNEVYPSSHQIQVIDNQVPSTSRGFEGNNYALSRAGSVSELNLAHLVLGLKSDIQKLTEKVEKQEVVLDAVVRANQLNLSPLFAQSFQETYNLKVPFIKLEDFLKFNQDLERSQKFCNEFTTSLIGYIDNDVTYSKNVMNMVKHYMSKDLAVLFTASKQTPNKMVLKDTMFCQCLLQAIKIAMKDDKLPLEREKSFLKALGHVISGARGWHNHNDE